MKGTFVFITKEKAYQSYIIEKKTTRECAIIYGMSQPWFIKYLKDKGIEIRKRIDYPGSNKGRKFSEQHKKRIGKSNHITYSTKEDKSRPWTKTGSEIKCDNCGNVNWEKKFHVIAHSLHFCNHKCHGEWKSKNLIGENHPRYLRVKKNCGYCNKEILCNPARLKRLKYGNVFCSKECLADWRRENVKGSMLYNWKGGPSDYRGENWGIQRRLTRIRDNYTCQRCNKTKAEMKRNPDVHHIIPFINFGIERYLEANDLSNLICYCNKCHKIVEEQYNKLLKC